MDLKIYEQTYQGQTVYCLQTPRNYDKGIIGFGDGIHFNRADAEKQKAIEERNYIISKEWEEKEKIKREQEKKAYDEYIESYKGFLSNNPLKRGKQLKTLEVQCVYESKIYTRKELLEYLASKDFFLHTVREKPVIKSPNGYFLEKFTKTEIEYFQHIQKVNNQE